MSRWMTWWYHDADEQPVFQVVRYERKPTPDNPRTKGYYPRYPIRRDGEIQGWVNKRHPAADRLVYGLPRVIANPTMTAIVTEGERDADCLLDLGKLGTCHSGGAGKFTEAQAESIAGHRGLMVLVADNDPAGARDVLRRFDLLRDAGRSASCLRVREVVPSHQGADLRDHLDAGYTLHDLRPADLGRLREAAVTANRETSPGGSWSYDDITPEEVASINHWMPRSVITTTRRAF